jgi:hypothetical protein
MRADRLSRRVAASLGIAAIISMGALTACAGEEEEAPTETTTTTTTTTTTEAPAEPTEAPAEPTEKAPRIDPGGPNPFSPQITAPAAPTAIPGNKENTG